MRTFLTISLISLVLFYACGKDSYESWPILTLKEINGTHVVNGGYTQIVIEFTDGDADVSRGKMIYYRERTNIRPIPNPENNDKEDLVTGTIPEFPDRKKGEILIQIPYADLDEDPNDSDTMFFKIVIEDRAGNQSDTLITPLVIAVHQ